jgi:hypothetical protein
MEIYTATSRELQIVGFPLVSKENFVASKQQNAGIHG